MSVLWLRSTLPLASGRAGGMCRWAMPRSAKCQVNWGQLTAERGRPVPGEAVDGADFEDCARFVVPIAMDEMRYCERARTALGRRAVPWYVEEPSAENPARRLHSRVISCSFTIHIINLKTYRLSARGNPILKSEVAK